MQYGTAQSESFALFWYNKRKGFAVRYSNYIVRSVDFFADSGIILATRFCAVG